MAKVKIPKSKKKNFSSFHLAHSPIGRMDNAILSPINLNWIRTYATILEIGGNYGGFAPTKHYM